MAEPAKHSTYSLEDIQRYLQGNMSAAEMHALEKAALQDAFLADAIEGYNEADLSVARQHLSEINASLFAEEKSSKVVTFNKKTQWLNIAALIIVLAGIGIVTTYILRSAEKQNNQPEIAKVQQVPVKDEAAKDSIATINNQVLANKKTDTDLLIAENKSAKTKKTAKRKAEPTVVAPADEAALSNVQADASNADVASSAAPVQDKILMSRSYSAAYPASNSTDSSVALQGKVSGLTILPVSFSGKVVDENNKPIAGATIISADKKDAVLTDINGNFNLLKTDTLLNVTASTIGYNSRNIALKQGFNEPIVLSSNNMALNEVVVTGYGTQKKKDITGNSVVNSKIKTSPTTATPVGGWKNFNSYVLNQLSKDTTMSSVTNVADIVELEFLVDKTGNPYDISIIKSPNEQHTLKAMQIIKNGPKWTNPSRNKKTKLVLNFSRPENN